MSFRPDLIAIRRKIQKSGQSMKTRIDPESFALIRRLQDYWVRNGIQLRSGAATKQIDSFEDRYSVQLPVDLRHYFEAVDGMDRGDADTNMFSFLPLEHVRPVTEELAHFRGIPDYRTITKTLPEAEHYFVIIDYMIWSAAYAIDLNRTNQIGGIIRICNGTSYFEVAKSFSEFLELYLIDWQRLI
jgi:cell wall assembly regulator SMI1